MSLFLSLSQNLTSSLALSTACSVAKTFIGGVGAAILGVVFGGVLGVSGAIVGVALGGILGILNGQFGTGAGIMFGGVIGANCGLCWWQFA